MGEVYLAEDQKLGRNVAIKILQQDVFDNAERLERFRREAQTAAKVSHPNVMAIYDIGVTESPEHGKDVSYIVMEFVDGYELSEYLREKSSTMSSKVRLAEKIASGLSAAHKLNIVHRDIKADNILITDDGEPKILDFGLAKPLDPVFRDEDDGDTDTVSRELTKAGKIMGTVTYMSPEQARGHAVDTRSDIFSFGILLYQMATGDVPFSGQTQMSTLAKILETKHEPPTTRNAEVPAELERIINKCLQKDASDRYQDTRDLVVDLRNLRRMFDSGVTDTITSTTNSVKSEKVVSQAKLWVTLATLAAAVFLLVYLMDFNFTVTETPALQAQENSLAILGFENKTGDESLDWLETGLPEILLTDLAQTEAIRLISRERIFDCFDNRNAPHSFDECVKAAKSLGGVRILSGSIFKFGEKIRIDARLEDMSTGKIIMAEKVMGDDPLSLVDSLIGKIAVSLDLTDEFSSDLDRARLTSTSSEAYRLYHLGSEMMLKGLFTEAVDFCEQSIAEDTSFALPYMKLGMMSLFRGRQQEGKRFLEEACKREHLLPIRDRTLLDIYSDVWLDGEYDNAFVKIKAFVANYPDDKESRTIYALLNNVYTGDTVVTFANLDTILAIDPTYQMALEQYSAIAEQHDNMELAVEMAERLLKYHPDSPGPYKRVAQLYVSDGDIDRAIEKFEEVLDRFPTAENRQSTIPTLVRLSIKRRDFDTAEKYNEMLGKEFSTDPYEKEDYFHQKANLLNWRGKLRQGMDSRFAALEQGFKTGDSSTVATDYGSISSYYHRYGISDSAVFYAKLAEPWVTVDGRLSYVIRISVSDEANCASYATDFQNAVRDFRSRVPEEFWEVLDPLTDIYEGRCSYDTNRMIAGFRHLVGVQGGSQDANRRELAHLLIKSGEWQEGIDMLNKFKEENGQETVAYHHLNDTYLFGLAYERLGETDRAVEYYREVLKYWSEAEIQLDQIVQARERLAELTS